MATPYKRPEEEKEVASGHTCVWKYMEIVRRHRTVLEPVSYTHLDVYKRQNQRLVLGKDTYGINTGIYTVR